MSGRLIVIGMLALSVACESRVPPEPSVLTERPKPEKLTKDVDPAAEYTPCEGDDCFVVPEGIMGLSFGMSKEAVKNKYGKLTKVKQRKRLVTVTKHCRARRVPPFEAYSAKATLGGESTRCQFDFVPEHGLVHIGCSLAGRRKLATHGEVANLLYLSLAKQFGKPRKLVEHLALKGTLNAEWKNDKATLRARAGHSSAKSSTIFVENTSHHFTRAFVEERAQLKKECELGELAKQSSPSEEEKRLLKKAKQFEDDLRPPLEQPK